MNGLLFYENMYARLKCLKKTEEFRGYRAVMEYAFYDIEPYYSSMREDTAQIVQRIIREIDFSREKYLRWRENEDIASHMRPRNVHETYRRCAEDM